MKQRRFTAKQMAEAMDRLPQTVKDAIYDNHIDEVIADVARRYNLRIDQSAALEDEIQFVMLGLERPEIFLSNLKKEANLDGEKASAITKDVEEQIFQKVKRDLMRIHEADYVPDSDPEKDIDYDLLIKRLYKTAIQIQGQEEADKWLYKIAGRDYVPTDPEKTFGQIKTNLSKIELRDNPITEMMIKNPPKGNLSNIIDLRNRKEDEGPRPVGDSSFLIKEKLTPRQSEGQKPEDIRISLDEELPKDEIRIDLTKEGEEKDNNHILDLDKDEPKLNTAPLIFGNVLPTESAEREEVPMPNIEVPKSEPSIIEKTIAGPVVSKMEEETVSSILKKPDIEIRPVSTNYVGEKDPYREPVD